MNERCGFSITDKAILFNKIRHAQLAVAIFVEMTSPFGSPEFHPKRIQRGIWIWRGLNGRCAERLSLGYSTLIAGSLIIGRYSGSVVGGGPIAVVR